MMLRLPGGRLCSTQWLLLPPYSCDIMSEAGSVVRQDMCLVTGRVQMRATDRIVCAVCGGGACRLLSRISSYACHQDLCARPRVLIVPGCRVLSRSQACLVGALRFVPWAL